MPVTPSAGRLAHCINRLGPQAVSVDERCFSVKIFFGADNDETSMQLLQTLLSQHLSQVAGAQYPLSVRLDQQSHSLEIMRQLWGTPLERSVVDLLERYVTPQYQGLCRFETSVRRSFDGGIQMRLVLESGRWTVEVKRLEHLFRLVVSQCEIDGNALYLNTRAWSRREAEVLAREVADKFLEVHLPPPGGLYDSEDKLAPDTLAMMFDAGTYFVDS